LPVSGSSEAALLGRFATPPTLGAFAVVSVVAVSMTAPPALVEPDVPAGDRQRDGVGDGGRRQRRR
jgi:hypothetical protein